MRIFKENITTEIGISQDSTLKKSEKIVKIERQIYKHHLASFFFNLFVPISFNEMLESAACSRFKLEVIRLE